MTPAIKHCERKCINKHKFSHIFQTPLHEKINLKGSTHTDGSTRWIRRQNSSYVADGKYVPLVLYRNA